MKHSIDGGPQWRATLDGESVHYAQSADDVAGIVCAPLVTADGGAVFDHSRDDFALVERRGRVEIFPREGFYTKKPVSEDNPFRVEKARPGELGPDYDKARFGP